MRTKIFIITLVFILLSGCMQNTLYYWSGYSRTLYKYKQRPDEVTLAKHMKVIKKIFAHSEMYNRKVAPGVYCEYGYLLLLSGDAKGAEKYFALEQETYPESTKFVQLLMQNVESQKGVINE